VKVSVDSQLNDSNRGFVWLCDCVLGLVRLVSMSSLGQAIKKR